MLLIILGSLLVACTFVLMLAATLLAVDALVDSYKSRRKNKTSKEDVK